jgi:cytochrome c556
MRRTIVLTGALLLGAGVAMAQSPQEQVEKTQLAMKSNLTSAIVLSDMARDKKPYDQAAVDKALAELDDVAKRFPSLFPESIKGLKPAKGDFYTSPKVWTERADFEAHSATFVKAVAHVKG